LGHKKINIMAEKKQQITVAKCEEEELDNVRTYLQKLEHVIKDNEFYDDTDPDVNQEIADVARKYPNRAFIVPLNLGILLDNYQDKDSDILKHPAWIMDMFRLFEEIDAHLSADEQNCITSGSELHCKVKELLSEDSEE